MVEYGNGVGQVAGRANGGGSGGQTTDVGAALSHSINDLAHTISTMPPGALIAGVVLIFVGLMLLRRAF